MDEFLWHYETKLRKAEKTVVEIAFRSTRKTVAMEAALQDIRRLRRTIKRAMEQGCTCRERPGGHCPVHGSPP